MTAPLTAALAALRGRPELAALRRGIEKESLRVTPNGELAKTTHPRRLGSPLTHPHITTDFSEAQLELITGVHGDAAAALAELSDIHRFVYANIDDELLWTASMPCLLGAEEDIPIARFGTSNAGRSKTVYRIGLSHRYGRRMQAISGIHYNFSLPEALWPVIASCRGESADQDFVTRAYFALIRNLRRYSWLLNLFVRRIAGGVQVLRGGRRNRFGNAGRGHFVPASCHLAAHGASRLSERRAGFAAYFLQQSGAIRGDDACGADDAVSGL